MPYTTIGDDTGKTLLDLASSAKDQKQTFSFPNSSGGRLCGRVICHNIVDSEKRIYDATAQILDADSLTYVDLGPCWLWSDDQELIPSNRYNAIMWGARAVGGSAGQGSGGETRFLWTADIEGFSQNPTTGGTCPVWGCCNQASGCVTCLPDPDNPDDDSWLSKPCTTWDEPGSLGFFDPTGNNGDPACGFWSCDGGETPCPDWPDPACGCDSCYPFWGKGAGALDLQSTGVALPCLFACTDGQVTTRQACLVIVPGGPCGVRLALVRQSDGTEIKLSTDL